ncbi:MerR family transcriptional regulator [Legionella micdadei]|uniref:DNA-binding transcriptional regulator, MerR family n=1 Tax=Legionella micdadei TaxID=451 RepID=A0A098GJH3_LEGMI|nr:MerR family transcriptional regulator [Legionella micdadei]ARG98567.1 MerR family transcriptional regulator [Legionella micdadei]ARH01311.1 MerR family transcriptional regulator [Legionella micdadei]KTD27427.1 mercury resistance transcriptional regulator SkgA [Legionella micdadei]NSL19363.1 MerR family transcriptional regulator [Legionella micdadei]CEG62135.1 Transcriptional regulator SkgA, mercury resistance [Legionella micdadei]
MSYTVKKLAKISGVSPRTLRFYDEIGLLKPAYYGENQYRYYEEEQLLMLQQILFFRELGFSLNDIQRIIHSDGFDKIEALTEHKSILLEDLKRIKILTKTIDKTISHIRGNLIMSDIEMYEGFDPKKQQEYENYLLQTGKVTQKQIDESWKNVRHWKKNNWEDHQREGEEINQGLVNAILNGAKPEAKEVQDLIQRHYQWVKKFWTPTQESYIGLGQMYLEHPDFKSFYTNYHPDLVEFLVEAMKIYAKEKLN